MDGCISARITPRWYEADVHRQISGRKSCYRHSTTLRPRCVSKRGGDDWTAAPSMGSGIFSHFYTTRVKLEMRVRGPFELPRKITKLAKTITFTTGPPQWFVYSNVTAANIYEAVDKIGLPTVWNGRTLTWRPGSACSPWVPRPLAGF